MKGVSSVSVSASRLATCDPNGEIRDAHHLTDLGRERVETRIAIGGGEAHIAHNDSLEFLW